VFVKIKFDCGAPGLITGHDPPAAGLKVHSKKCTVIPPTNVLEVIVAVDVSFAHLTISPAPVKIAVPPVPVTDAPVGLNSGAADAAAAIAKQLISTATRPLAKTDTSTKLANRGIFMVVSLVKILPLGSYSPNARNDPQVT